MLTYADTQRRFPHVCPQRHCSICKWEQDKADLADAKRRIAESAVRRTQFRPLNWDGVKMPTVEQTFNRASQVPQ